MQLIMFDRQSIFIHGMNVILQERIPGVNVQGVSQADDLWRTLEDNPDALVMLDGDFDAEFCRSLLQQIAERFAKVKVLITATDCRKKWLQEVTQLNVQAIIPRDSDAETFTLALNSVAIGMMFIPRDCITATECGGQNIRLLSARQREILTMLAAGESNKQIGRLLNISTGTVKAHLESLYQRLEVKNRTQAAMMLNDTL
ncbi:response regulator transcription factor [Citrobacter sp. RHBSTW-00678]|uniref:helix-turn-helix transcriptional regulator n=1 Tax=Citrobacter TaxID=544 RepID=UPI000CD25B6D|nr:MULTISPECIES: response regulator transcription factor [Citrobacter]TKV23230.1 response regulator transcription factor [Citrobacter sp. TBCS-11]AUV24212.1 helix-turn-helix transcriptional regulator [Citrobacter freundii complex sp. CFNIH3]MBA7756046.1 response regulator transcription factor [Citrobacter sp. RHBSTW-00325]MBA8056180.1 response regulator transcription factor [Citrobacter sp. RHBSTW-00104]MDM3327834.1 response regulator transcription factor [Citrobacter sp. Cb130]